MKPTSADHTPTRDETEWLAQEAARAAQRCSRPEAPDASAYDRIAHVLAQPDVPPPPSNLAHVLATRVEALAQARRRDDRAFRRNLHLLFGVGYGSCIALAVAWFHRDLAAVADGLALVLLRSGALGWLPVVATCAGITWLLARKQARNL